MSYVKVTELPQPVQAALESVGYAKADILVEASQRVTLSSGGAAGRRSFAALVNLTTGQHVTHWGSWGGENMFVRDNPVDSDRNAYELPGDGVAVTGSRGGSSPCYATLHVPASMVARILPAPAQELTEAERDALYCYKSVRAGAYRADELKRRKVAPETIDAMVERGYLKRNRAGAITITTDGKNAVGNYRGY